ncbi:unnamed protein product [Phaeothamnion confervicola]
MLRVIENACNEMIISADWALNMQLVDMLGSCGSQVVIKETVRGMRLKLLHKSSRVVLLALTLAETLVKNCQMPVHQEIAGERFMTTMANLARQHAHKTSRESLQIADKALDLIQSWGEAFLPMRRELPGFAETYFKLRKESMPFQQQYKEDRPPVLAPGGGTLLEQHSREAQVAATSGAPPYAQGATRNSFSGGGSGGAGGGGAALVPGTGSVSELLATVSNATEMLQAVLGGATSAATLREEGVAVDLAAQLTDLSPRVTALIERRVEAGAVDGIEALFKANDALDAALQTLKDVLAGKLSLPLPSGRFGRISAANNRGGRADDTADLLDDLSLSSPADGSAGAGAGADGPARGIAAASKPVPALAAPPGAAAPGQRQSQSRGGASGGHDSFDLLTGGGDPAPELATPTDFSTFELPAAGAAAAATRRAAVAWPPTSALLMPAPAGGSPTAAGGAAAPAVQAKTLGDLSALYAAGPQPGFCSNSGGGMAVAGQQLRPMGQPLAMGQQFGSGGGGFPAAALMQPMGGGMGGMQSMGSNGSQWPAAFGSMAGTRGSPVMQGVPAPQPSSSVGEIRAPPNVFAAATAAPAPAVAAAAALDPFAGFAVLTATKAPAPQQPQQGQQQQPQQQQWGLP